MDAMLLHSNTFIQVTLFLLHIKNYLKYKI